jgi:hypothetical protein
LADRLRLQNNLLPYHKRSDTSRNFFSTDLVVTNT